MRPIPGGGNVSWFALPHDGVLKVFAPVPYLNGGLFECLDGEDDAGRKVYRDGFSRRADKRATLPNRLFFGDGDPRHPGLIPLLRRYDFTLDENHATDADIALDPELLGKVFENLLASYNPETGASARKASGSFYTPREIVDYMVDQALRAALAPHADAATLDALFADDPEPLAHLPGPDRAALRDRIAALTVIDPACGSGAFPMGLLNRMVDLLGRLGDTRTDYARKLDLIEHAIYGVDIQPIAIQISKLRFFIALLCDQTPDPDQPNAGLDQLPNLETHLVIANSLIGFDEGGDTLLGGSKRHASADKQAVITLREKLEDVRRRYVRIHSRKDKLALRREDESLRRELSDRLKTLGFGHTDLLAKWKPYDPGSASPFFDPQWMFGLDKFDIVIGNPPYVQTHRGEYPKYRWSTDLYLCFMEKSLSHLMKHDNGTLCFITPKFYLSNKECQCVRKELLTNYNLKTLTLCIPFTSAITENVISLICGRGKSSNIMVYDLTKPENEIHKLCNMIDAKWALAHQYTEINTDLTEVDIKLLEKIREKTVSLSDVLTYRRGVEIGKREICNSSVDTKATVRILIGEDVEAYKITWNGTYANPDDPRMLRFHSFFQGNALYLRRVAPKLIAASYHGSALACTKNLYCLKTTSHYAGWERYITALLNSALLFYVYKKDASLKKDKFFPEVQVYMFEHLPLKLDENYRDPIEKLVVRAEAGEDVQAQIDAVVYRLYGLTGEEIALVERSFERGAEKPAKVRAVADADEEV